MATIADRIEELKILAESSKSSKMLDDAKDELKYLITMLQKEGAEVDAAVRQEEAEHASLERCMTRHNSVTAELKE